MRPQKLHSDTASFRDCAVPDISVLSSTFEITQLAVEKGENMVTNYSEGKVSYLIKNLIAVGALHSRIYS